MRPVGEKVKQIMWPAGEKQTMIILYTNLMQHHTKCNILTSSSPTIREAGNCCYYSYTLDVLSVFMFPFVGNNIVVNVPT